MPESSLKLWKNQPLLCVVFATLSLIFLVTSMVLPLVERGRYASPDETAVVRVAERLAHGQSPRIDEPLAVTYPWLHPRSWVSHGAALVPVGFLGWPLVLVPAAFVGSWMLPWLAWLWFISSVYPFYQLLRRSFSGRSAYLGVLAMVATPMVLLYANRSLFPNPAVLAGALWSLWFLESLKKRPSHAWLAGLCVGITIIIRPIELIWILPWWVWKARDVQWSKSLVVAMGLPVLVLLGVFLSLNAHVYGGVWAIGYWLRDNPYLNTKMVLSDSQGIKHLFPFGLHPRAILWNLRSFTSSFLWPSLLCLLGAFTFFCSRLSSPALIFYRARSYAVVWLSAWTGAVLLMIYGSGLYQDHVQAGAVTVANSFLRYLLPLAPLTGLAAAYLAEHVQAKRTQMIGLLLLVLYSGFGLYAVAFKDDEGLFATQRELRRYVSIHDQATHLFPAGSVMISDRSDKLFGPELRVVSPTPPLSEIQRLVRDSQAALQVGLFARPLSQRERDEVRRFGLEVLDMGVFGREHLYRVISR